MHRQIDKYRYIINIYIYISYILLHPSSLSIFHANGTLKNYTILHLVIKQIC